MLAKLSRWVGWTLFVAASLHAQSPLILPFAADQVGPIGTTLYFDMTVLTPVTFTSLDVNTSSPVGATGLLRLWMGPSTWVGDSMRPALWTSIASGTVTSLGVDQPSPCTFAQPFTLAPGTYAFAIEYAGVAAAYATGDGTNQTYANSELQFRAGGASGSRFAQGTVGSRVFQGIFHYTIGGTPLPLAVASTYGNGCYAAQTSFCETFPSPFSGNFVDLDHTTIRMVPNAGEGYDVTRTAGAFLVPPAAPPLPRAHWIPAAVDADTWLLAPLVAAARGYRCVVVTTDKQSEDKVNLVIASYISEVVLALMPWAARLKTPMITPGAASNEIRRYGVR